MKLIAYIERFLHQSPAPQGRIMYDGTQTTDVDDETFHRAEETAAANYSMPIDWLEKLVAFLKQCNNGCFASPG